MPLGVISIVGKYRTGKSFFVNRVLLNRSNNNGFSVGPTINPCTKVLKKIILYKNNIINRVYGYGLNYYQQVIQITLKCRH